jgi:acetyl-CoA carboxylase carboxyl transferase subunit beta
MAVMSSTNKNLEDFEQRLAGEELTGLALEEQRAKWFRRRGKGILTRTSEKRETPDGLWVMCPQCKHTSSFTELKELLHVCPSCNYHHRIGSDEYFNLLFDDSNFERLFDNIFSKDFLQFTDLKPYETRLKDTWAKTDLHDSMSVAHGKVKELPLVIACMDFDFIGGSLGSVMGEKICRAAHYSIQHRTPLLIISKSGGARMMESAFSLMQLPKTLGSLSLLSDAGIPYFSLCTDPTFGGTTASFSMLGDIIMAEPGALIGFAGPRVIKETIKKDLPKGFQRSEFLMEHGFLDLIVDRKQLKDTLGRLLSLFAS